MSVGLGVSVVSVAHLTRISAGCLIMCRCRREMVVHVPEICPHLDTGSFHGDGSHDGPGTDQRKGQRAAQCNELIEVIVSTRAPGQRGTRVLYTRVITVK